MARYAKSLGFAQRETAPAIPAEGNVEMYLKDDGKLYKKDSSGTETPIGGDSLPFTYNDDEIEINVGYWLISAGTVSTNSGDLTEVIGTGTAFLTDVVADDYIRIAGAEYRKVVSIESDTELHVDIAFTLEYPNVKLAIAKKGNDSNDGSEQTAEKSLATIQAALDKVPTVNNGYVYIRVVPGIYDEYPYFENRIGTGECDICVDGDSSFGALLNVRQIYLNSLDTQVYLSGFESQYIEISNCRNVSLENIISTTSAPNVVYARDSAVYIGDSTFSNKDTAISSINSTVNLDNVAGSGNFVSLRAYDGVIQKTGNISIDGEEIEENGGRIYDISSGETSSRPAKVPVGYRYFDTDLGKPIWYTGTGTTNWVDATGTETEMGGGGGGITDINYADLVTAIGADGLIAGSLYRITDFATRHYIVALNNDRYSGEGNEITGVNEPLIVFATSPFTISHEVMSSLYPQDIIYYDWNPANWMEDASFADVESYPATAIIQDFKGVIYFRHDTLLDNSCGYDFRNCKFRRWESTSGGGDFKSISNTGFAYADYLTFNPSPTSYELACRNNHIPASKKGGHSILGNNVFHICVDSSQYISATCNNTLGEDFVDNTIDFTFSNNVIGSGCNRNIIGSYVMGNNIARGFAHNIIGQGFSNNKIGNSFRLNTVGNNFIHNNVEDGLNNSGIGIDFTAATHVYGDYNCTLFRRLDGATRLRYYNNSDVLTVVAANA